MGGANCNALLSANGMAAIAYQNPNDFHNARSKDGFAFFICARQTLPSRDYMQENWLGGRHTSADHAVWNVVPATSAVN